MSFRRYRIYAEGEVSNNILGGSSSEHPLGILPHQIRGSLSQFSQMTLLGRSSDSCTACSTTVRLLATSSAIKIKSHALRSNTRIYLCIQVVNEYRQRGMEFILEAINHPSYLEDLTGLTELMKSASEFNLDWDNDSDDDDTDIVEI